MGWMYRLDELAADIGAGAGAAGELRFSGISTDTRTLRPGELFFALQGENFDAESFVEEAFARGAVAAVCTRPHAGGPTLLVANALAALQAFASAHRRRNPVPMFAVTGSCGKTTVKDFAAALLGTRYTLVKTQGNLNNDIGVPRTLLALDESIDFAVVEMGANHQGEIARLCALAEPTCSAVTIVAPAHLEGFGRTIDDVERAKGEIAEGLRPDGVFFVNMDDPRCVRIAQRFSGRKVRFGAEGDVVLRDAHFAEDGELLLDIAPIGRIRLPLPVRAHATNVLLAVAVALEHGVDTFEEPLRAACAAAARFKVKRVGPAEVLDDTYNANPASMAAALQALRDRPATGARYAVLGTMLELGPDAVDYHRQAGAQAAESGAAALYAYGPHAEDLAAGASAAGLKEAVAADSHEAIAQALIARLAPGDVVLFKGSRGMAMEKVIALLDAHFSAETPR